MKLGITAIVLFFALSAGYAQVPGAISYQGLILNPTTGETAPDGPHTVKFAFYDAAENGTFKWETSAISVSSFKGLFTTLIPIPENAYLAPPLYVQLTVDGLVLNTRVQLTTVPYAFKSATADQSLTMDAAGLSGTIADERLSAHLQDLADGSLSGSRVGAGVNAAMVDNGLLPDNVLNENLQDLADGSLSGSRVGAGVNAAMVDNGLLPDNVLNENLQDLADGTLSGSKIGSGINAAMVDNGILPDAVLTPHLQDLADGTLSGSKIGSGVSAASVDNGILPNDVLDSDLRDLADDGILSASKLESLNASKVTAGTFDAARIPSLDASKITTGTLADARIPNLNATKLTSGTLSASVLPTNVVTANTSVGARVAVWTGEDNRLYSDDLIWNTGKNSMGINTPSPEATLHITQQTSQNNVSILVENDYTAGINAYKTGIEMNFPTNPNAPTYGIDVDIANSGNGERRGATFLVASANGNNGLIYGINSIVDGAGSGNHYGVNGKAIGTSSATKYGVRGEANESGTTKYGVAGIASGTGTNHYGVYGQATGGTNNYAIYGNGNGYFDGNVTVSGNLVDESPSDFKLKTNIKPMGSSLLKILSLKPSTYYFRKNEFPRLALSSVKQNGLIAQEVEKIFPELVAEKVMKEQHDVDGKVTATELTYKSLDYTSLIPILIKGIQEQQTMIEELKNEIKKMKSERVRISNASIVKTASKN